MTSFRPSTPEQLIMITPRRPADIRKQRQWSLGLVHKQEAITSPLQFQRAVEARVNDAENPENHEGKQGVDSTQKSHDFAVGSGGDEISLTARQISYAYVRGNAPTVSIAKYKQICQAWSTKATKDAASNWDRTLNLMITFSGDMSLNVVGRSQVNDESIEKLVFCLYELAANTNSRSYELAQSLTMQSDWLIRCIRKSKGQIQAEHIRKVISAMDALHSYLASLKDMTYVLTTPSNSENTIAQQYIIVSMSNGRWIRLQRLDGEACQQNNRSKRRPTIGDSQIIQRKIEEIKSSIASINSAFTSMEHAVYSIDFASAIIA